MICHGQGHSGYFFRKTLSLLKGLHSWLDFDLTSHKVKYDNILNNFESEGSRAKAKVTVVIFRKKHFHCSSTFIYGDRFCCNFTQMFSMKNILIKFKFQLSRAKVNVKMAVLRNMLLAVRCCHLWIGFYILSKFLLLITVWTLLIYRAFSEINRYNQPYQIISRTVKYQSFVINIINLLGALYLISINLFLILISKLVPLTLELARNLNMFIRLQVMLLRAI